MTEISKILLTAFLTVLTGTFVFIIGQLFAQFILRPINKFKEIIGKIQYDLIFFGRELEHPGLFTEEDYKYAQNEFRKNSSDMISCINSIPFYALFQFMNILPPKDNAIKAGYKLIGISNSINVCFEKAPSLVKKHKENISELLKFDLKEHLAINDQEKAEG